LNSALFVVFLRDYIFIFLRSDLGDPYVVYPGRNGD